MDHGYLIDALGGGTKLAEELSKLGGEAIEREAVYKWKLNGVPWKWRPYVADLARQREVKLPEGFLPLMDNEGGDRARAEPTEGGEDKPEKIAS